MTSGEQLKEKLCLYLSTLSESAQKLLLRGLEQAKNAGTTDAASELILAALREVLKDDEPDIPLEGYAEQAFFATCKPFLGDVDYLEKEEARISPASLDAIWKWIKRDIASKDQQEQLAHATNDMKQDEITFQATFLRDQFTIAINQYLKRILQDLGGEQKLSNQLGGEVVYKDLVDILAAADRYAPIKPVLVRLPEIIENWASPEGVEAYSNISRYIQQMPMKASWLFSAITPRLTSPRAKIQLACKLAGSDDADQVAATVYAPAIRQIVADMEAHLGRFEKELDDPSVWRSCLDHLLVWSNLAKAMQVELEVSVQSEWGKSLARMKTTASERIQAKIEAAPGLLRKALRAPKSGAHEVADDNLLEDARRAIELFSHAERIKDSLALNGSVSRIRKELDQSFEILTTSLLERTRTADGSDLDVCKVLGENAAVYGEYLFDADYSNAFRRQLRAAASIQELQAVEA